MENASKALIIAGAVLIAIVLISIGISMFNSQSGVTEQTKLSSDSTRVQLFNSQILPYFGSNCTYSQASELISTLIVLNSKSDGPKVFLNYYPKNADKITHKTSSNDLKTIKAQLKLNSKYNINITSGCGTYKQGYMSEGYIGCVSITEIK